MPNQHAQIAEEASPGRCTRRARAILSGRIRWTYSCSGSALAARMVRLVAIFHRLAGSVSPAEPTARHAYSSRNISTYLGTSGRGPTRLMSPRNTLNSCGSSSIFDFRSQRPTARDARIGPGRDLPAPLGGVDHHRAKLVDRERSEVSAHARLAEQNRAGRIEPHGDRRHQQDRTDQHQPHARGRQIERPLGRGIEPARLLRSAASQFPCPRKWVENRSRVVSLNHL